MINYNDPAILYNGGVRIPIDTPEKYNAVLASVQQVFGGNFDGDALSQMENRIRGGQTSGEIVQHAQEDYKARFLTSTNNRVVDSQSAQGNALYGSGSGNQLNIPGAALVAPTPARVEAPIYQTAAAPLSTYRADFASVGPSGVLPSAYAAGPTGLSGARVNYAGPTGAPQIIPINTGDGMFGGLDIMTIGIIAAIGLAAFYLIKR